MGTKACIAEPQGMGWSGYYVHYDGGPQVTGLALVEMTRERGAEETLRYAARAPQGWTHFPDEPSVHHHEPFIVTPYQDGAVEWLYLIDSDRQIQVYRGYPWEEPCPRQWERVAIIDPQSHGAPSAMIALDGPRGEIESLVRNSDFDPVHSTRLATIAAPFRSTPEGMVRMIDGIVNGDDERPVELTEAEADAFLIGAAIDGMTADKLLEQADRLVTFALGDQTVEDHRDTLGELSRVIDSLRWELAGDVGGRE